MAIGSGEIDRHARRVSQALALTLAGVISLSALPADVAQDAQKTEVARKEDPLPLKHERTATFTVSEGTWISLDVSPDGRTILFELLGDLYTLPIAGGKATRLTEGPAYDAQPRYSPDGKQIAFVSDRDGGEQVWLVAPDGTGARALTRGTNTRFQSPDWTADGHVVVSKGRSTGFGTVYDQRGYDLMLLYVSGGTGLKMLPAAPTTPPPSGGTAAASAETIMGAATGRDPRYVYAAVNRPVTGSAFANWQIVRFDRQTGQSFGLTSGSAFRPLVSPDERYLVYATRDDAVTRLRVRDVETGDDTWLTGPVSRDETESIFSRDLMPGSSFLPDGRSIVTAYGGKIWRLEVPSGKATEIPFTATVDIGIAPAARFEYRTAEGELTAKQIRYPVVSPDGKRIAFTALNRVWVMDLAGGTPRRLTSAATGEHWPAWSPDGRSIAYVTWSDIDGGDIYRVAVDGRASAQRLTTRSAYYDRVTFSPDGSRLVFVRGRKQARVEGEADTLQLSWMPAGGGAIATVAPTGGGMSRPHFGPDPTRIFLFTPADGLVSVRFDGTDRRSIVKFGGAPAETASMAVLSPKGDRAIALLRNQVYLLTVPMAGDAPTIAIGNPAGAAVPVKKVTKIGGDFLSWNREGTAFHYALGRFFFSYDIAAAEAIEGTAADTAEGSVPADKQRETVRKDKPTYDPARVEVKVTATRDTPDGVVVLRGARILTMASVRPGANAPSTGDVIDNSDIVISGNRITAVGPRGSVMIPTGAREIDVSGKTILPGWVDIHAHMSSPGGVLRTQQWEYATNLAYGVTTTRNPQTGSTDVLAYEDLVEIGEMLGPRILSTGPGLVAAENITSLDDAKNVLRRYSEYYGTHYIKQYGVGPRKVRQWVIMAAREQKVTPVTEPYYDVKKDVTEMQDGYIEMGHGLPIFPVHDDLLKVMVETKTTVTPTLITTFGGPKAYEYFYTRRPIHKDVKLRRFWPHDALDAVAMRRSVWYGDDLFIYKDHATELAKMVKRGIPVTLGAHGNMQGIGVHWELEMIASGGMPLQDVLRGGTIWAAEAIGLAQDLGSIEAGKLADLQVLDKNPLDDIAHVSSIRYVMKNGRLYQADTLKEIWPRTRDLGTQWWQTTGSRP